VFSGISEPKEKPPKVTFILASKWFANNKKAINQQNVIFFIVIKVYFFNIFH